ncbi:Putative zincin peptidase [Alteribacillus persepolensis]|uniref:Putative zincin peptidase n=1 Tax=Alteribacillus persepolensis TaxID=568899 RepID=A0A1G8DE09_9BACI|nr:DUF3267 domain-containing protein [Alteribacillus persepolensis]SDH55947.1 Putative zincin peptidase [Alteribacillus persepolensis]
MNCWKSINLGKEYTPSRLVLLSVGCMILTFILSFLVFSFYYMDIRHAELSMVKTLSVLALLYPIHALLHFIPLWLAGAKTQTVISQRKKGKKQKFPFITLTFTKPIGRNFYVLAMLFPTLFIHTIAFIGALLFPPFMFYFLLVLSLNTGLSVYDFIYVKQLHGAPRHCFIEQKRNRIDILLKQPV